MDQPLNLQDAILNLHSQTPVYPVPLSTEYSTAPRKHRCVHFNQAEISTQTDL